jgi:hypothetical protein
LVEGREGDVPVTSNLLDFCVAAAVGMPYRDCRHAGVTAVETHVATAAAELRLADIGTATLIG